MRKFGVCLALTGAAVWMTGCGTQFGGQSTSSSRGGLAVVDLDKVAAETGRSHEMKDAYELQENSYKQVLLKFQAEATSQLQAKAKELEVKTEEAKKNGEEAPDDEKRALVQFQLNARNQLAQAQNAAGAKLGEYKQVQIAKFRSELKPILQDVASKRGLSIVIPKNDGLLLAVDPGVDITDDVIKAYRDKKPTSAAPAPAAAPAQAQAAAPAAARPEAAAAKPAAEKRTASKPAADKE